MFRTHNRHNKKSRTTPAHTYKEAQKGKKKSSVLIQLSGWLRTLDMVGMTGFEPATSASRTQRSTKLSHIPLRIPSLLSNGEGTGGCPTRIRTQTNRVRVCRATFTQSGNSNMNYYNCSGEKVKTYRKKTAFIFYFWRKVPLIARAARRTIHIANAKPMKERNKPCLTRKPRTH